MPTDLIKEGDRVLLYISPSKSSLLYPNQTFQNTIKHSDLINRPYNTLYRGCYILRPNPLHHINFTKRYTQILFEADISLILFMLNIKANDTVLESGTGSGTLTHFISRKIANGTLHSYERNLERFTILKKQFEDVKNVNILNGDVNSAVFEIESLDAVFLDVPEPCTFIREAHAFLKNNKKICVFVPTMNQVLEVSKAMNGIFEMRLFENVKRKYDVLRREVESFVCKKPQYSHTGFLVFGTKICQKLE